MHMQCISLVTMTSRRALLLRTCPFKEVYISISVVAFVFSRLCLIGPSPDYPPPTVPPPSPPSSETMGVWSSKEASLGPYRIAGCQEPQNNLSD